MALDDLVIKIGADVGGVSKGISKTKSELMSLKGIGKTAGVAMAGIAVAAAGLTVAMGLATRKSALFDAAMRNVNTIAKLNETQFKQMGKELLGISVEFGKDAQDLAKSLYNINSAGFAGAEGITMLRIAAKAAEAGLSSTDEAASGITTVLNAYGLSAEYASDVSDILFKTVEKGVTTFPELSASIGQVVSTANAAGVPFDQIAAALATMTKGGINTTEAVTALNASIMKILTGTDELNALFSDFGSSAAAIQKIGLAGVMDRITQATGGSAEKIQKLGFMIRDFKAVASLARQEGAAFTDDLNGIANAAARAGSTQAAYDEQSKSSLKGWNQMTAAYDTLIISIGDFITKSEEIQPLMAGLKDIFIGLSAYLSENKAEISSWVNTFIIAIPLIIGQAMDFYSLLKSAGNAILGTLSKIAHDALWLITLAVRGVLKLSSYLPGVGKSAQAALDVINNTLDTLDKQATKSLSNAGNAFGDFWDDAGSKKVTSFLDEARNKSESLNNSLNKGVNKKIGVDASGKVKIDATTGEPVSSGGAISTMAGSLEKGTAEAYRIASGETKEQSAKKTAENTSEIVLLLKRQVEAFGFLTQKDFSTYVDFTGKDPFLTD